MTSSQGNLVNCAGVWAEKTGLLTRVMDALSKTIADVSSVSPLSERMSTYTMSTSCECLHAP